MNEVCKGDIGYFLNDLDNKVLCIVRKIEFNHILLVKYISEPNSRWVYSEDFVLLVKNKNND